MLDEAPCGFIAFSDDGVVRVANHTLLELLGYTREELLGKHVESILAVGSRIFYQTHLFPLLRLHGRADEVFVLLRGKNGEDVAALTNAVRRDRDGSWITECVFLRLQERRKFEDALLAAKKQAETALRIADARREEIEAANELLERQAIELELSQQQLLDQAVELEHQRTVAEDANRAKSTFLAMMSHELRTPLNAIGGYVQLIEMGVHGPVTPAQTEALGRVERSQRHLLRLINDVLNLARIESGRVEYRLESLPIAELVNATMPMIEPQLAAHQLGWEVNVPSDLIAYADREKVEQILLNLLSNATKFTPPGGRVTISATGDPSRVGWILIEVRDTGVGIAAAQLEQVFAPFVQVDVSPANRAGGTGLGLAISRDLARGMGGDLTAHSEPNVGSTFVLELRAA